MKKVIYKYSLKVLESQNILLPIGSEILTIQNQREIPCLWVLVDPNENEMEKISIEMFGTGNPIHYDMGVSRSYISTFQLHGGALVFHAFKYTGV
jgi:hypothetical protein